MKIDISNMSKIRRKNDGFTLLEILIIIVILAILSAIVGVNMSNLDEQTQQTTRKADLQTLSKSLELYKGHMATYPDTLDELQSVHIVPGTDPPTTAGPFVRQIHFDPTDDSPYEYEKLSDTQYILENEVVGN